MAVRRITNAGNRKIVGKFASLKMRRTVSWESQIERDYLYLLEFDTEVLFYLEQPFRIRYLRSNKVHYYTPDFLVRRKEKKQIIEVKPDAQVKKEENDLLFRTIAPICQQQGYEFLVVTDSMIRASSYLNNIKLLYRYARIPIPAHYQVKCYEFFKTETVVTLGDLIQFFESQGISRRVIYGFIYQRILETDLSFPINLNSAITLSKALILQNKE
ncbi:MAG TPA: TnsA endonuclease N-terminal domain-containing protein [Blastocatellia bacterium]|nr:TnsA endonuclease N-terminal domain-containing protein [Blastocatellia bacterium]